MTVGKTKINFFNKREINGEQISVDCPLTINEFKQILWVETEVNLESVDVLTKEINVMGQTLFEVLYLDKDNNIQKFKNSVPFTTKISNAEVTNTSSVRLRPEVISSNYITQNNKCQSIIEIKGDVFISSEMEFVCDGAENLCVKSDVICSQEMLKTDCTILNEELTYPITDKMNNILGVKSKVILKNIESALGYFTAIGEICTTIKYLTISEDMQKIMTINYSESFKREIEVEGLKDGDKVLACAEVKFNAYKYELDKENNKLIINVPINICYRAFSTIQVPNAIDVFSLTNEIKSVTSSFTKSQILGSDFYESKIEGSSQISEDMPRIDKVIGYSNPNLVITDTFFQDGKLYLEGVISLDLSYLNDENESIFTTHQEIPFKVSLDVDLKADNIQINSNITNMEVVSRRGREIFLDAKLSSQITATCEKVDVVLNDIEIGEALEKKKHAIEIYFGTKGDELWDIAKELRVEPDAIIEQNPDLVLPLEQNENIVIYNTRNKV